MKTRIVMIIMAVALIALPAMAQQQEWKSTSAMQGTGSTLAPQVTEVGAVSAAEMGVTTITESYSPAKGPRKGFGKPGEEGQSEEYPIGDAMLPMLMMAVIFAGIVYYRRKKTLNC
jgi:hypothetical protein